MGHSVVCPSILFDIFFFSFFILLHTLARWLVARVATFRTSLWLHNFAERRHAGIFSSFVCILHDLLWFQPARPVYLVPIRQSVCEACVRDCFVVLSHTWPINQTCVNVFTLYAHLYMHIKYFGRLSIYFASMEWNKVLGPWSWLFGPWFSLVLRFVRENEVEKRVKYASNSWLLVIPNPTYPS